MQSGGEKPFVWLAARTGDKTYSAGLTMKERLDALGYAPVWYEEDGAGSRPDHSSGGVFSDWAFGDRMLKKALIAWRS